MKGGALPSLSSRDRLPGLAVATPGLCYVPHKSSSCFTDALPHLGAGLICQAELPGKFFCSVIDTVTNSAAFLLLCSFPPPPPPPPPPFSRGLPHDHFLLLCSFPPPPPPLPPHFCRGLPWCPLMLLTVGAEAGCHGEFISCYCICHCFHRGVDLHASSSECCLSSATPSKIDTYKSADRKGYSRCEKPLPILVVGAKLWQAVGKPRGNWVTEEWERDRGLRGVGLCFYSSSCAPPRQHAFKL